MGCTLPLTLATVRFNNPIKMHMQLPLWTEPDPSVTCSRPAACCERGCRYHNADDTCALTVALDGELSTEAVASHVGGTRQAVSREIHVAMRHFLDSWRSMFGSPPAEILEAFAVETDDIATVYAEEVRRPLGKRRIR